MTTVREPKTEPATGEPTMPSVNARFRMAVERFAARPAVRGETVCWTYRELDELSDRIAAGLVACGVRAGGYVPLFMGRSPWLVAGCLGVLKAGAAYVPIDPLYPADRRRSIVEDLRTAGLPAEALVGLVDSGAATAGDDDCARADVEVLARGGAAAAPSGDVSAEEPAYVMFTSGSTGRPKGVIVPHRGIVRLVCDADYAHFEPGQVWAQMASVSFDAATLEIWGALLNGGCVTILEDATPTLGAIERFIAERGVTDAWFTAALFNALVDYQPGTFGAMKQVITGGEAESVKHMRAFKRQHPGVALIHGYGPTESTTFALCHTITEADVAGEGARVPIGRPIRGTSALILNEQQQPVADGEAGELYLGGLGVGLGYLNDRALTEAKFVRLPGEPGVWYRTGDRVTKRADGAVVFLGRVDRQVKIRGYRIEPEEIEARLMEHPLVEGAAVEAEGETSEARHLVAYCAVRDGAGVLPDEVMVAHELRAFMADRLPAHMLPARVVPVRGVPRGLTGKIDRRALLSAGRSASDCRDEVGGLSAEERAVADAWRGVLPGLPPARDADLFLCGGHSLTVMRLVAELAVRTGKSVAPSAVFKARTLERIAALLPGAPAHRPAALPSEPLRDGELAPCGPMQASLYYEWRLDPSSDRYHVVSAYTAEAGFDEAAFAKAFAACVNRHESLRVTIEMVGDVPMQRGGRERSEAELVFREAELDWSGEGDVPEAALRAIRRPFDLERGPVARAHVFRLQGSRWLVALAFQHAVLDEWSVNRVLGELEASVAPARQPEGEARRHAAWAEHRLREREASERGRSLGEAVAGGRYPMAFDLRLPCRETVLALPAGLASELDARAAARCVSPFALCLAAYALAIREEVGVEVPRVLSPMANRGEPALADDVACAIDLRVLECDVQGQTALDEVARRLHMLVESEQDAGPMGLAAAVEAARAVCPAAGDALLQFAMVYRIDTRKPRTLGGVPAAVVDIPSSTGKFGLLVGFERNGNDMVCRVEGPAAGAPRERAVRIARRACEILAGEPASARAEGPAAHVEAGPATGNAVAVSGVQAPAGETAPHDILDEFCADAWRTVLGSPPAGDDDDFFEAGGTSLRAMRLQAEIRRASGHVLDLGRFVAEPTFGALRRLARASHIESVSATLGDPTSGACLVGVPGMGGHAISYYLLWRELAGALPKPLWCLSLDFVELMGERSGASVTRAAEVVADQVERGAKGQRVFMVAYSMGGVLGLESAVVLKRRGIEVEHLWLLDAFPAEDVWPSPARVMMDKAVRAWRSPVAAGLKLLRRARRVGGARHAGRTVAAGANAEAAETGDGGSAEMVRVIKDSESVREPFLRHRLAPYAGPVTVVQSFQPSLRLRARPIGPFNGFDAVLTGPRDSVVLPVRHLDFLRSGAPLVAAKVAERLGPMLASRP